VDRKEGFYWSVLTIALPITLQSLIMALLNLTDQLMVGQLGDTAIASVGMASKIFGILQVVMAGLATGVSVYAAQFWGSKDKKSISQLLGLGLLVGGLFSALFTLFIHFFPKTALQAFTSDGAVIDTGSLFLEVIALSYVPTMLTMMYSAILRSTMHVKLPMFVSMAAVGINVVLNYLLIFGHCGCPQLGLRGSAVATTIARLVECALIIGAVYYHRLPGGVQLSQLFGISRPLAAEFFKTTYPILLTELLWVLGETVYAIIYSRMGTLEMTAMTISFPLQGLSTGLLSGLASAAGVMIGNKLGANEREVAFDYSRRFIRMGIVVSVSFGVLVALVSPWYVSAFNISAKAHDMGIYIVLVFAGFLWAKVSNMIMSGGILISGGDSRYVFAMESTATWIVGVPSGLLFSFVWKQPVYLVYLLISIEEVVRFVFGLARIRSKKWMRNLVGEIAA